MEKAMKPERSGGMITKEALIGIIAIGLGSYNILSMYNVLNWGFQIPQLLGNIMLVLAGLFLWITAFKLWRHRYHTRNLF